MEAEPHRQRKQQTLSCSTRTEERSEQRAQEKKHACNTRAAHRHTHAKHVQHKPTTQTSTQPVAKQATFRDQRVTSPPRHKSSTYLSETDKGADMDMPHMHVRQTSYAHTSHAHIPDGVCIETNGGQIPISLSPPPLNLMS